jgi:hypothetical protein
MKRNYTNIVLLAILVLAAAVMRIITAELHLPNITPVVAIGLFGGVIVKDKRYAYLLPLLTLFIADAYFQFFTSIKGFYGIEQILVYVAMALVTFLGNKMEKINGINVIGYSLISSFIFFVVSNFGSYLKGWNGYDMNGLLQTYLVAIPFYKYSILGDLVGSIVLFGSYSYYMKNLVSHQTQKA